MREPGNLVPRHFFFARHFLCKDEKCLVNFVKQQKKCLKKCGGKEHIFCQALVMKR